MGFKRTIVVELSCDLCGDSERIEYDPTTMSEGVMPPTRLFLRQVGIVEFHGTPMDGRFETFPEKVCAPCLQLVSYRLREAMLVVQQDCRKRIDVPSGPSRRFELRRSDEPTVVPEGEVRHRRARG